MPTAIDTLDGKDVIRVAAVAANAIGAEWYLTDVLSYGRGSSELKSLRTP